MKPKLGNRLVFKLAFLELCSQNEKSPTQAAELTGRNMRIHFINKGLATSCIYLCVFEAFLSEFHKCVFSKQKTIVYLKYVLRKVYKKELINRLIEVLINRLLNF